MIRQPVVVNYGEYEQVPISGKICHAKSATRSASVVIKVITCALLENSTSSEESAEELEHDDVEATFLRDSVLLKRMLLSCIFILTSSSDVDIFQSCCETSNVYQSITISARR